MPVHGRPSIHREVIHNKNSSQNENYSKRSFSRYPSRILRPKSATSTETTQETAQERPQVEALVAENVDVDQFAKLVAAGEGLVDVRTPDEYAEDILQDLPIWISTQKPLKVPSQHWTRNSVYVYCRSGGRSGKAMKMMNDMGFKNVYNLDGGMNAWTEPISR